MAKLLLLSTESSVNNMTVSATDIVNIEARKGARYTLIDQDTGQYPKHLSMQQDGDDLTILQNGEPILVIKQYYQDDSAATFFETGDLPADNDVALVDMQSDTVSELNPAWSAEGATTAEANGISPSWLAGLATIAGGVLASNMSTGNPVDNSYTITVAGTAGYLTSTAQVTVYDNAGNILIQEAHDFSQGNYTYSVTNGYIGTLLITVTDTNGEESDYTDETSGEATSLNATIRAMAVSDGSGDITINITPLTELATQLAGVGENNIVSENQVAFNASVANLFGVEDILALATTVTDSLFDTTNGLSAAEIYGVVLAALSGVDSSSGSLNATLAQLLSEITVADDGSIAITQNGLDTITAGIAAYNTSEAGQANPISTSTLSAPLISKASGGLTAAEVESGVTVTVSGVESGDHVILNWGGVIYSYTLTDGDIVGNGKGVITVPNNIITQVDDGDVTVRYTLGEKVSAAVIINVNTNPVAPGLALATDTGASNSDGITTDATVNVTGLEAIATWQYSLDSGTTWLNGTGTSFELAADASYAIGDIQVMQTDAAGNTSAVASNASAITVDNTVAAPGLVLANDTGVSHIDSITTDATVNVTGLEVGTTWQYSLDNGTNWTTGAGTSFELAADTTYASGSIQVKQTDAAGNASATTSSTAAISVDNTLDDDNDLAITPLDTLLNASDVSAVSVTLSGIDADAQSVVVSFNKDLSLNESVNATYENGVWSAPAIDLSDWSDGEISYAVIVTDIAGNTKVVGVFDDTALNMVITENGVGFDPNGLGANAESIKVTIADDDNSTDDVVINAIKTEGTWAFPDADLSGLSGTTRTLSIEIINTDGSQLTQIINNIQTPITLDTEVAAPSLALATDTGSSNSDGITSDATMNVVLAADVASWQYSLNGGNTWATGTGTSFELGADTTYAIADIQVKQTDVAGNVSTVASNAAAITTDTTLAAPSLALATDTGSSNSDGITTDATVNVTLAADVASWQYSLNGGSTWTTGSGTSFELATDTTYAISSIQVKQTDTAGNASSAASNAAAITTDTTPLAVPSLTLATDTGSSDSDGITTDATVNVTLAADVASWQYSLNGGSTWSTGSGTSFELGADTNYAIGDIQVKQSDAAGNVSAVASNAAAITTDTTLAAPTFVLATDTGSSSSDGITTDATVNVTLADDVASWQYSLDGSTNWTTGTGTSFELAADTTYAIGSIKVKQTDVAGNISTVASNAAAITVDNTAPLSPLLSTPTWLEANGNTSGDDSTPQITAVGNDGAYVVTWYGQDSAGDYSVFVQLFNADGTVNGTPVQLEAIGNTSGYDFDPQVTAVGNDGAYVVTWSGPDSGNDDSIFVQLFAADGSTNGAAVQLEAMGNNSGADSSPQVSAVGSSGAYVVTWYGQDSVNYDSIFVQLFNADGTVNGATVQLEAIGNASGYDYRPQVSAVGSDGAYVVTWFGQDSEGDHSIFVQLFKADGTINGAAVQLEAIGNTSGNDYSPQVSAVGNDGAYVVTWYGSDSESDSSIFVQLFKADGTINGATVQLEAIGNTSGSDHRPQVSAVGNAGAYVVTWYGEDSEGDDSIFVQLFNADGTANGAAVQLEAIGNVSGLDHLPQVSAVGSEGAYVVTWQGLDSESDYSVFVQLFKADGTVNGAVVQLEATGNPSGGDYSPQVTAVGNDGAYVVTWYGQDSEGDGSIFVQLFDADGRPVANSLINNTQSIEVQSSELGSAYLVSAAVAVTSLSDITALADNLYNSVAIESVNTDTALAASGLVDGTYYVYVADTAGNFSQTTQVITIDTTAPDAPNFALATDSGSSNSDNLTNDATVNVTGLEIGATWHYSLDGGTNWTTGSDTSFELGADATYAIAGIQVKQTDAAGNTSSAESNAASITTDTSAPTASAIAATINNSENASVQSSELGTAYLVASDISVTSLSDITSSVDNQWNSVAITAANASTNLEATGLVNGDYKVYTTDAAGNLSAASSNTVTVTADTSIVVFDLITGHSSNHSSRTFDADTTYTIYLRVDSSSSSISLNSAEQWQSANNLGQDDVIVLVGNGSSVKGRGGAGIDNFNLNSGFNLWATSYSTAAYLTHNGIFDRATANNSLGVDIWSGNWPLNPNSDNTLNQIYLTDMPTGVLTSQGLNPV